MNFLTNKRILVTGVCGTVGSENVGVAGDYDRLFADLLGSVDADIELVVERLGLCAEPEWFEQVAGELIIGRDTAPLAH